MQCSTMNDTEYGQYTYKCIKKYDRPDDDVNCSLVFGIHCNEQVKEIHYDTDDENKDE